MKKNKLSIVIASTMVFAGLLSTANATESIENLQTEEIDSYMDNEQPAMLVKDAVSNKKLSQTRMEIMQKKLDQNLEREELNLLKIQNDRLVAEKLMNNESSDPSLDYGNTTTKVAGSGQDIDALNYSNGFDVEEDYVEDYSLLSEKYDIGQDVGFVYKTKSEVMEEFINSEEFLSMQNIKDDAAKDLIDIVVDEVEPTIKLNSIGITMLSLFGKSKTAKLNFEYIDDDGVRKNRIIKNVTVREGLEFTVEVDSFIVKKISSDGVMIRNKGTGVDVLVRRNS